MENTGMATSYPFDVPRLIDICRQIVRFSKRKSLLALVRSERELTGAPGKRVAATFLPPVGEPSGLIAKGR